MYHVKIVYNTGFSDLADYARRDARLVGDLEQGHLGLIPRIGNSADDVLLHDLILMANECSKLKRGVGALAAEVGRIEARAHQHSHALLHGTPDRPGPQDLGPCSSH